MILGQLLMAGGTGRFKHNVLIVLLAALLVVPPGQIQAHPEAKGSASKPGDSLSFATDDEANTIEIFKRASPTVVFISKTSLSPWFSGQLMQVPSGSASGIIWDMQGYIVTNYHVVQNADRLHVVLQSGEELTAELVGSAPEYDLAVVKVKLPKIYEATVLPLGDSDQLQAGQKVLSIGNPFGFETSLSVGVISALGREIPSPNRTVIRNAIQTDAAINPGSSGGPILNSLGQLIGINVQIYSPSGASAGIGLALPINTVKRVVPSLIEYGYVRRVMLGIELRSDQWSRAVGVTRGIPVIRAAAGMPAAEAGITGIQRQGNRWRLGDVIIAINDKSVNRMDDLYLYLEDIEAGQTLKITSMYNGEEKNYFVKPIEH